MSGMFSGINLAEQPVEERPPIMADPKEAMSAAPSQGGMFSGINLATGQVEAPQQPKPYVDAGIDYLSNILSNISNNPDVAANLNAAESVATPFSQLIGGAAGMVAEPLAYGKSAFLDIIARGLSNSVDEGPSGRKWWGRGEDPMHTYTLKEGIANRAFEKGQEAAAEAQKWFGYQPKSKLAQETVIKPMEEAMSVPGKALNLKGDWYKSLGVKSVEVENPKIAHYLELLSFIVLGKAAESVSKATIKKYTTSAEQLKAIRETGNITSNFDKIQDTALEIAHKIGKEEELRRAQYEAELELETRELRNKIQKGFTPQEQAQAIIENIMPEESPLATTPKERQQIIDNTLADAERFPEQPARVVQPVDELAQAREAERIAQERKPLPTSTEKVNQMVDKGWISNLLPNENDRWRQVFVTPEPQKVELAQRAKYPPQVPQPTTPIPEAAPKATVNVRDVIDAIEKRIEVKTRELNNEVDKGDLKDPNYIERLHEEIDKEVARHRAAMEKLRSQKAAPVEPSPALKISTQETPAPEAPRVERRSREYVPSSKEATLQEFPPGRETSQVIREYKNNDQIYTTKGGNTDFVSHSKAAKVAQRVGGTVLPTESGKFVVALEPQKRVMFQRDAIRTEAGTLAEADAASQLKPLEATNAEEAGRGTQETGQAQGIEGQEAGSVRVRNAAENRVETQQAQEVKPKPKVPNTKLTNQLRELGWSDEQISQFSLGERKTIAKDQSRPVAREQDVYGSKAEGEASRKFIEETPSTPMDPDVAEAQLRSLVPALEKWTAGDESVDINAIREQIRKISDNFDANNLAHDKVTLPADKLLSEISRTEMERKGIKIEEDIAAEDLELLKKVARAAELDSVKPTKAELDAIEKPVSREARKQELRAKWEEMRARRSTPVDTPEKAITIANNAKETQPRKMTARQRAEAEARAWEEANRDDPVLNEIKQYENERALNLDEPAENIDATDLWGAFKSLLSNDEGQWTIRRGKEQPNNPIERLTPEHVAAVDRVYKVARRNGLDPLKLMKESGISDDLIAATAKIYNDHIEPRMKLGLEPILQGPYKDRNPSEVIQQKKGRVYKGQLISEPPVMFRPAEAIANMPDIGKSLVRGITNPIYIFEKLPPALKEYYYQAREALHKVTVRSDVLFKEVEEAAKGLSKKSLKRVMTYAIEAQERGPEILQSMGIKSVKSLTESEMQFYRFLRGKLEDLYKQTNEVRTAIGKQPLKNLDNYFTFMRSYSFMERLHGRGEGRQKVNTILDDPSGIYQMDNEFRSAAFPYTIRSPIGTMPLDMNPVAVFKKYAKAAIRHQEVSPLMAEINAMLDGFKTDKLTKKGSQESFVPRIERPELSAFLTNWSNYIGGMTLDWMPPTARWILNGINKNIAFSTLSGNVTSALMQPASLVETVGQIGHWHTMKGIAMTLDPRNWKVALEKSNVLKSRVAELDIKVEGVASKVEKIAEAGLAPLKWLDAESAVSTWLGAHEFAKSRKMGAREAIRFADDTVTKTQASTMPNDTVALQRTVAGRTLAQFQTFMISQWNFLTHEIFGHGEGSRLIAKSFKDADAGTIRKVTRYVVAALATNEAYKAFGIRAPHSDPVGAFVQGDKNGDSATSIALAVAGEFAEAIPFVGNIKYAKSQWGPLVDITSTLVTGGKYGKSMRQELTAALENGDIPTNIIEQAARLGGVPGTNQLMKWLRAKKRGEEGFNAVVGHFEK